MAVRRPGEVGEIVVHGLCDELVGFRFQIQKPELLVLVAMGEPMSIGRRSAIPAEDFRVFRELLRLADTVGGICPELCFTGSGGGGDDGVSVGAVTSVPDADA